MTLTQAHTLTVQCIASKGMPETLFTLPMFATHAQGAEPAFMSGDGMVRMYSEDDDPDDLDVRGLPQGPLHLELNDPQGYLLWSSSHGWVD